MKTTNSFAIASLLAAVTPGAEALSTPAAPPPTIAHKDFLQANSSDDIVALPGEVDVTAAYASSTFPISPSALINRAKQILSPAIGVGTQDSGACLSDDFEFVAAVVGPINKSEYLGALGSFKLQESFDIQQNYYGFTVDPLMTNRVWFFDRQIAKQIAPFMGVKPPPATSATRELILPPQLFHMDFNEQGLVKEFGFYTIDRRQCNTGGLGGAFGYFFGVGKPLPIRECQPYKPSFRFRMLQWIGNVGKRLSKKNKKE